MNSFSDLLSNGKRPDPWASKRGSEVTVLATAGALVLGEADA